MLFYSRLSFFICETVATFTFPKKQYLFLSILLFHQPPYTVSIIFRRFEVRKVWERRARKKKFPVWILPFSLFGSETCIALRDQTIVVIFAIVIVVDDIIGLWGSIEHVYFTLPQNTSNPRHECTWLEASWYFFFSLAVTLFFKVSKNTHSALDVHEDFLESLAFFMSFMTHNF